MLECYIPDQYRIRTQDPGAGAKLRLNTNLTLVCKTCELGALVGPGLNPTPNFGGKLSQTPTSLLPCLTAAHIVVAVDREAVV